MKRSVITTLIIGVVVAVVVGALHATKVIGAFENAAAQLVSDYAQATKVVGDKWQYVFVLLIALGVTWLSLSKVPKRYSYLLIALLLVEFFVLSWVCSLYRVFFQPAPSVLALLLALAAAEAWSAFLNKSRSHLIRRLFADRLSQKEFHRLHDSSVPFDAEAKTYEVSVVVCDIGNKVLFAEDSEPCVFTEAAAKFIRETAARLVEEGAYLQAADGEGVVGIFGFPAPDAEHVQKAVRLVLNMTKSSREGSEDQRDAGGARNLCAGISSGTIIAGALQDSRRPVMLASGEPI